MDKLTFLTNIYFNENHYLSEKAAALNASHYEGGGWTAERVAEAFANAGLTSMEHYTRYGAFETSADGGIGINTSAWFDQDAYYSNKATQLLTQNQHLTKQQVAETFQAAGTTPLAHYSNFGYMEWLTPTLEKFQSTTFTNPDAFMKPADDIRIDSLLITSTEHGWQSTNVIGARQGNVLTYTFPDMTQADPEDMENLVNLASFTPEQMQGAREAMEMLHNVTGVQFQHVEDPQQANILFFSGKNTTLSDTTAAYSAWQTETQNTIVINTTNFPEMKDLRFGTTNEQFMTIIHEIGHALGLKHPFDQEGYGTLPQEQDNYAYTLMSYTIPQEEDLQWYFESRSDSLLSPYDIAALQWIYGTDGMNGSEGMIYAGA